MLWGMDLMATMVFFSIGILLPIWKSDLGVTPVQAGLLGSVGFMGFGLFALPAAIWLTTYNPRRITLACAIGMAIMAVLLSFATTVALLLVCLLGFVVLSVSRLQMQVLFIQQWFVPKMYSTINSVDFGARAAGQMVCLAITPALVALLGGWKPYYLVVAVGMAAFAAAWIVLGRERHPHARGRDGALPMENPALVLRRWKVLWVMASSQIGTAVAFGSFISFFPSYAIERHGISLTTIGLLMSLFPVGGVVGSLVSGPLSQALGRRKPFVWGPGLVLPIVFTMLLHVDYLPVIGLLLMVAGFSVMVVAPVLFTMPLDMGLKPREVAVAFGLMRTLFPVGATVGPIFVGLMLQATGSLYLGLSIVAPLSISLFFGGMRLPETGPKGQRQSSLE